MDSAKRSAETFYASPANPLAVVFSSNQHVSYFLNLGASTNELQAETDGDILAGDRNLVVNGKRVGPGAANIAGGQFIGFDLGKIHGRYGHLLLADGSVEEVWSNRVVQAHSATNLLLMP